MKITKRQLRRIIKEEKRRILRERLPSRSVPSSAGAEEDLFNAIDMYVIMLDQRLGSGVDQEQLKAKVLNFVDGYFEDTAYAAEQAEREEELGAQGSGNPILNRFRESTSSGKPSTGVYEGTVSEDMPAAWQQILKDCLKDK